MSDEAGLAPDEHVILAAREDLEIRTLSELLIALCAAAGGLIVSGVLGWQGEQSWSKSLIQFLFAAGPLLVFALLRARSRVVLTNRRVIVLIKNAAPQILELSCITRVKILLGTLYLYDAKGHRLTLPHMRQAGLIARCLRDACLGPRPRKES